jgi:PAS domain S-box-containing protein
MMANEHRIRVLLVEDSPSDAQLLGEFLQEYLPQQFVVERVERLEDAIQRVSQASFDVVLLDLTLPDSTGLDTCTRMRQAAPHVPIVVLTGVTDETIALEAMHQGVEDYLVKGQIFHGGTIGRTVRYAVERHRSERTLREAHERLQLQAEELRTANEELRENEEALRRSEQRVRLKLDSILLPQGDLGNLELADIIDAQGIQSLMDDFYALTHFPMAIIDLKGRVLVGVGWQEICTRFHRVHPEACRHCIESDTQLTMGIAPGEFRLYKCKHHMWDVATPLLVGGNHVGNLFSGQFFFEDEPLEREPFRAQARQYGFDEQAYLAALEAVPRLSRETVDTGMAFLTKLARMLSQLSYGNIRLARSQEQLLQLNRTLKALSKSSQALMHATEEATYLQEICQIIVQDCGHAMVWIGYAEQDEAKSVRPVAHAGLEEGYLKTLQITWADTQRGRGPTGTAIRTGQPSRCRNVLTDPQFAPWREQALQRGYASSLVLPLLAEGRAFGAITIYSREPDPFARDEEVLLLELAADLAYGIISLRLRAAHARAEQSLRENEQRLRLALEGGGMGRWEWDIQSDSTYWDPRVYGLLGLDPRVPATSRALFGVIDGRDRDAVRQLLEKSLADGADFHAEFRVNRPGGEILWLISRGKVIRDEQGQAIRMLGVMYDITQRKQMEADLRRLNDQLEEEVQAQTEELKDTVDRLQTAFQELEHRAHLLQKLTLELSQAEDRERKRLAEILHDDLQQQLAAAKFHLSLLSNRVPQDPAIHKTLTQLDQILKDSIEKSRSLSHELSPALLYQGDLGETFEWMARQLKAKHGLTVHVESRDRIEAAPEALKVFLYRTAQEILFNVVKHARVKEARLRLQRLRGGVWLTISDQGQGFDPRALGRTEGFGLLSIRERIELLGGRMKIRSAPGRGSTFLVVVPDGQKTEDGRQRTEDSAVLHPPSSLLRSPFSVLRVLLADDHKVMREGLAALLNEQPDVEVVGQAGNGREAVDLACRLVPDVVVMDVAMPVMAGDEAARRIKRHVPRVRVVALSMFEEADMAEAMRKAGAEAYLLKTAPSEKLLAAIRGPFGVGSPTR